MVLRDTSRLAGLCLSSLYFTLFFLLMPDLFHDEAYEWQVLHDARLFLAHAFLPVFLRI